MTKEEFFAYLRENKITHLIFDFDATICDMIIDWDKWQDKIEDVFRKYDPSYKSQDLWQRVHAQNDFIKRFGKKLRDTIVVINRQHEKASLKGYRVHPKILDLIKEAAQNGASGVKSISVWTSNDTKTVLPILTDLGINRAVAQVVGRDSVMFIKPDPDGFGVINSKNYPKESYLMIGDSKSDEQAAQASGIKFMHVSNLET